MSFVAAATWSAGRPSRSSSDLRCGQTTVHDSQIPRRIDFSMCVDVGVPQHDLVFSSPLVSIVFSSLCCRPGEPHDSSEGNLINLKCHRDELGPWRAPSRHPGAMAIAVETHKCRRPAGDRKWRLEKSLSTPATPPPPPIHPSANRILTSLSNAHTPILTEAAVDRAPSEQATIRPRQKVSSATQVGW